MRNKRKNRSVLMLNGRKQSDVPLLQPLSAVAMTPTSTLKLDFGCGPNPRDGFEGVDQYPFDGKVKHVLDLRGPWPWDSDSVAEAHTAHFVEHLDAAERVHFVNELHRVLVPGGACTLIVPHWASCRAYGDPTHKWPPVSEFWFFYLSREWRLGDPAKQCPACLGKGRNDQGACQPCGGNGSMVVPANAPHTDVTHWPQGYACDFGVTWGWTIHPAIQAKNQEAQQFAVSFYKEAVQDTVATLVKRS